MGAVLDLLYLFNMEHIPPRIEELIQKLFDGTATPEENQELNHWYHSFSSTEVVVNTDKTEGAISDHLKKRIDVFLNDEQPVVLMRKKVFWRIAAAVVVAVAVIYFMISPALDNAREMVTAPVPALKGDEIVPGGNKAVLTLGDGTKIVLDTTADGSIGKQGNTKVVKPGSGLVQYRYEDPKQPVHEVVYNTISTPRGGQYQVQLPDGTRVWLNASSSLRFPTEFSGTERTVEITGEAYFEVAHNPLKPFTVKINETNIRVLGTHFNVMAYQDEASINTTLLEGSLIVQHKNISRQLQPGNQAQITKEGSLVFIKDADTEEVVAWKNGKFLFNSADMNAIMRQVERWYDVDVHFEGVVKLHFSGKLNRYASVGELLRKIELSNEVFFRVEKRSIIVLPGMKKQHQ